MNPPPAVPRIALLGLALILALMPAPGRAAFVVSVANVTAAPGSQGSFDVVVANTNAAGGASYAISSDVLTLQLVGTTGVTFTGVSTATTSAPYLFSVSSTGPGSPFSTSAFPGTKFTASDAELDPLGGFVRLVAPGQTFGVARVSYRVAATATSGTISVVAAETRFYDFNFNTVPFTTTPGSFAVGTGAVPEPGSMALTALGLAPLALLARRARKGAGR